jgi:hypothetical protein
MSRTRDRDDAPRARDRDDAPRARDRDDRPRSDDRPRRDDRRDRDDMGPPVKGFGDEIPAFMLIPIPRLRREAEGSAPETDAAA